MIALFQQTENINLRIIIYHFHITDMTISDVEVHVRG